MLKKKDVLVAFLIALCLAFVLSSAGFVTSSTQWDPWSDVSGPTLGVPDGTVNMRDINYCIQKFNTHGTPIDRANVLSVVYDSGWTDVRDKAGQYFDVVHNLNSTDLVVDIQGKTALDGVVHQKYFGGTDFVAGWNKTYGGLDSDGVSMNGLIQTKDGGCALGSFTGGKPWLVKTDARGNIQWNRTYGEVGDVFPAVGSPLVQTADGGYAMAVTRQSAGSSDYDFWLVRTDAIGTPLWNQTYGGADSEYVWSMIQTREGGFAVVGAVSSSVGGEDGYLVVTDSIGNMLWNKTYGGSSTDGLNDIVQTGDGFAMAGVTYSYAVSDRDIWLVKINANGNQQWYKTYGAGVGEDANALIQTFDGGYAIVGTIHYGNSYAKDMWLVKTDSSGNMQWNHAFGAPDPGHEIASDVVQTSDGGYALIGMGASDWTLPYDSWLVRTDASGNKLWDRRYGDTGNDWAYCLIVTADGGYAMAGGTTSYGSSCDAWLVKTDAAGNVLDGFKYGLAWVGSTLNTIELYRGTDDENWNFMRVQIWKRS